MDTLSPVRDIRRITTADREWLHEICTKAYDADYYDPVASETWFRAMMRDENHLLLRGEHGFMTAIVSGPPWAPKRLRGSFGPVASIGGASIGAALDLVEMTTQCLAWAKGRLATEFFFGTVTGADLGPLARRFGGRPVSPHYIVDL